VNALIQIGEDAITPLATTYETSPNLEQRLLILDCLREVAGEQVLDLLVTYLQNADDELLTYALLKALNEMPFTAFIVSDREMSPQRYFVTVVEHTKQALKSQHPLIRAEAVFLWGQLFGIDVLDDIFTATKDPEPTVRMKAIQHLGYFARVNDELTEHLIILLSDDHPNIRKQAAIALGNSESSAAFPALLLVLDDSNAMVRRAAVTGLGSYLSHHKQSDYQGQVLERVTDVLVNRCRRYEDGLLKIEICTTLQQVHTAASQELLLQLTEDSDFDVRKSAILALGAFHHVKEELIPILLPFLNDDHWSVREAASTALGVLQVAEAEAPLLGMVEDPDLAVRRAVFVALGRLGSLQAIPILIAHLSHEELDYAAYQALSLIAVLQKDRILEYNTQENPKVHLFLEHIFERQSST
jgi:HEAT repeat protein